MAQDSRRKRYVRRLKRQNTLLGRMLDVVVRERNAYRHVVLQAREQAVQEVLQKAQQEDVTVGSVFSATEEPRVVDVPGADDHGIHGAND